jgi:hypothetical protein
MGILPWWRLAARRRPTRFDFTWVLGAGFLGAVLLLLVAPAHQPAPALAVGILVLMSVIVQLAAPWEPTTHQSSRRSRLRYA